MIEALKTMGRRIARRLTTEYIVAGELDKIIDNLEDRREPRYEEVVSILKEAQDKLLALDVKNHGPLV